MSTESLMWLLPVVFMLHDFEEIVLLRPWLSRHREALLERFPGLARRLLPAGLRLSTNAFALIVAEEFALLAFVTLLAVELALYDLWVGVLIAFALHLLVHLGQALALREYVPVVATSAAALPYCVWALVAMDARVPLDWGAAIAWAGVATVVLVANLVLGHRLASRFQDWLETPVNA